ncbi:Uncharacterised protein [Streptococcus pneumoniae]|nr:Uncharacterised protein [Streptococcus pneumoniae]
MRVDLIMISATCILLSYLGLYFYYQLSKHKKALHKVVPYKLQYTRLLTIFK